MDKDAKKKKRKMPTFLEDFLKVKDDDLKLQFAFDHIENYAIAGGVVYAGMQVFKHSTSTFNIPYYPAAIGIFLCVIGSLLWALNMVQGLIAAYRKKPKMTLSTFFHFIFIIFLAFSALEFFWFQVINHAEK